jgi:hypothetical protein
MPMDRVRDLDASRAFHSADIEAVDHGQSPRG